MGADTTASAELHEAVGTYSPTVTGSGRGFRTLVGRPGAAAKQQKVLKSAGFAFAHRMMNQLANSRGESARKKRALAEVGSR